MGVILPTNATNNITGFYSLGQYVQEASGDIFFPAILFGLFIILFVITKSMIITNGKSFVGSSFIIMILGIMLSTLGFLAPKFMYITIIMTAVGAVWAYVEGKTE
jgi:hypothetical protein